MAKRYDTQEDFERDKLKEQANDLRIKGTQQFAGGMWLIVGSFISDGIRELKPQNRQWMSYLSRGLTFAALIEGARSYFTHREADRLAMQRDRMGPEHVVLPADMSAPSQEQDCSYISKNFTSSVGHQTLLEQAIKSEQPLTRS